MKKKIFYLLALAFSLGLTVNAQNKINERSLLVSYCDKNGKTCLARHLEKLRFSNGKLISRKKIFTFDEKQETPFGLDDNRYIPMDNDKHFDVVTEKLVTLKSKPIVEDSIFPVQVSPDGQMTAAFDGLSSAAKLEINRANKDAITINASFETTVSENSSIRPSIPILWIDNERILTQSQNGSLVLITLDGKISPFLELPCDRDDSTGLRKTKAGKIIYMCSGEEYVIDVAKKTFAKSFRDLENDFSFNIESRDSIFYYQNKMIGRTGVSSISTENYLAVSLPDSDGDFVEASAINKIKVWNSFTKQWTTFTFDGWNADIEGWVE